MEKYNESFKKYIEHINTGSHSDSIGRGIITEKPKFKISSVEFDREDVADLNAYKSRLNALYEASIMLVAHIQNPGQPEDKKDKFQGILNKIVAYIDDVFNADKYVEITEKSIFTVVTQSVIDSRFQEYSEIENVNGSMMPNDSTIRDNANIEKNHQMMEMMMNNGSNTEDNFSDPERMKHDENMQPPIGDDFQPGLTTIERKDEGQQQSEQDQAKQDQSKQDQSTQDQAKQDQAKQDQVKQDQAKQDQVKQDQAKQDQAMSLDINLENCKSFGIFNHDCGTVSIHKGGEINIK